MKKITFILSVLISFSAEFAYTQNKAFTIEDLYKIQYIGAPVISPDGMHIAHTITKHDLPKGKSRTNIYIMDTNGGNKTQITSDGKSSNPIWAKDSKSIYYVSTESDMAQVYLYSFKDHQSRKITNFSMGVNDPKLSPDNKLIAFSSEVYPECGADSKSNARTDSLATNGPVQAYVADQLLFRHWTDYAAGK